MEKKEYISGEERKKCRRVAEVFSGLDKEKVLVLEIGRFGFLRLLSYQYPYGFDDAISYCNSKELFEDLWYDWLYEHLQKIADANPALLELDYEDMLTELPEEKQKEFEDKRREFAEKAGITL
ncbi:MAG: hypothetical protein K1W41_23310 [Lachnospiraceae bacterium]